MTTAKGISSCSGRGSAALLGVFSVTGLLFAGRANLCNANDGVNKIDAGHDTSGNGAEFPSMTQSMEHQLESAVRAYRLLTYEGPDLALSPARPRPDLPWRAWAAAAAVAAAALVLWPRDPEPAWPDTLQAAAPASPYSVLSKLDQSIQSKRPVIRQGGPAFRLPEPPARVSCIALDHADECPAPRSG